MANILIADDNQPTRELANHILSAEGHNVIQAVDGGSAIKVINEHEIDCIIVDQYMPDDSGFNVAKHVQANGFQIPMVLITGHMASDLLFEAQKAGFVRILSKPFQAEELLKTVRAVLRIIE